MKKSLVLDMITEEVHKIPILDIIGKYVELPKRRGSNHLGLCPFHNDTRLGSFMVNETLNRYACYACGAGAAGSKKGGDSIEFIARMNYGGDYHQAKLDIAYEYGIINAETYKKLKRKDVCAFNKEDVKITRKREEMQQNPKHEVHILNAIYSVFLNLCTLSEEHRKHLKEKRHLSDESIEEGLYRTNGQRGREFMEKFVEELKKKNELYGLSVGEILGRTPGFFQRFRDDVWEWTTHNTLGILIPIRNEIEQITGLQIRLDIKKNGGPRYIWFTSSFAKHGASDYFRNGTSASVSLDIIYPTQTPSRSLFITEGRFKAEAIAKKIGAVSISVPGVGNYRGIEETIKKTEIETKRRNPTFLGFQCICIAFDSDFQTNEAIYLNLKNMSDDIQNEFGMQVFYILWDKRFKGIDDFLYSDAVKQFADFKKMMKVQRKEKYDSAILLENSKCVKL